MEYQYDPAVDFTDTLDYYYSAPDGVGEAGIYEPRVYTHTYDSGLFVINIALTSLTVLLNAALIYFISGKLIIALIKVIVDIIDRDKL